ncbi:PDZ domain-containing protein [Candidatus Poribacteria bacterium]|nr:PDZ domain-containing protein [Candidatus Poribacteria bacterium]
MECRGIDGQVVRRQDDELKALLEQFVCVRVVRMWGIDLSLFSFDGNLTWAVFFMNADKTIYGRYGSRSDLGAMKDISLEGFKKAAQGALELHAAYPSNRASLAGKTGSPAEWRTPENFPAFLGMYQKDDISVNGCIHCHYIPEGRLKSFWMERKPIPDRLLWGYPMPDLLGFVMDANERATVQTVISGSEADKAGLSAGDQILQMEGQPIISTADIQWVLHNAGEPSQVELEIDREGERVGIWLPTPDGWRRQASFTYSWETTYPISPGFRSRELDSDQRKERGLAQNVLALEVKQVYSGDNGWGAIAGKGYQWLSGDLRKGDVIIEVDGSTTPMRECDLIAYLWQQKGPGDLVRLTILRGGNPQTVTLRLPML